MRDEVPAGFEFVRVTPELDATTMPGGIRRNHHVAEGVWGRIIVNQGPVVFIWEDDEANPIDLNDGDALGIPAGRKHRVVCEDPAARFAVEFYRIGEETPVEGTESTGLLD